MSVIKISNTPHDYDWGRHGGIAAALGWASSGGPEAELWLGAHPSAPSQVAAGGPWRDLSQWEQATGQQLPFLMKLLAAARPLSLQAHPSTEQAREGYVRENVAGIPLSAPNRNYKDAAAKPEMILAVEDGFEALCGFRPVKDVLSLLERGELLAPDPGWGLWRAKLASSPRADSVGIEAAVDWLLDGGQEPQALVAAITRAAELDPEMFCVVDKLTSEFPGDPGIAVGMMLNYVRLNAFEALWLPAGSVHAYLSGLGVELMGPSDNVLRGGLTNKHVDAEELSRVVTFEPCAPDYLTPKSEAKATFVYRPSDAPSGPVADFELWRITAPASLETTGPAIGLVLDGTFRLEDTDLAKGEAFFIDQASRLELVGQGNLMVATTPTGKLQP